MDLCVEYSKNEIKHTIKGKFNKGRNIMDEKTKEYVEKLHAVLLDMMIDLDKFLRDNNINYSIACGIIRYDD